MAGPQPLCTFSVSVMSLPARPLLSILIPSFNCKGGLRRVLKPLLFSDAKARHSIEVVISDDSPQPLLSCSELAIYASKIPRFRYIHNACALGAVKNWNQLLSLGEGEYSWICHHDEYLANSKSSLSSLLEWIQCINADIFILPLFKSYRFGPFTLLQRHTPPSWLLPRLLAHPGILFAANPIGPPSAVVIRSSIAISYDVNLKWFVDVEYYTRLFASGVTLPSILPFSCRVISDQDFDQSITRSMAPTLRRTILSELYYLSEHCPAIKAHTSPLAVLVRVLLVIVRSLRTRPAVSLRFIN